jgi:uncharacterized protein (DUF1800 family)
MAEKAFAAGPGTCWAPYAPTREAPWDVRRVVHLHRRAGFAATWAEVQGDLRGGPEASVDRLLAGAARRDGVPAEFEAAAALLRDNAAYDLGRLKAWWVYRMLFGPDPLGERLTLFWHDHFATSDDKVQDWAAMRRQNETFRELARAPFGKLLNAAVRDPALLVFLDAPANRKGHPNENLARELMELFTLGIGHYTERDVKEGARALTGWSVAGGAFQEVAARHDAGAKTFLGHTGPWKGADLVRILLEEPATATRLATKFCGLFLGEGAVDEGAVQALASALAEHGLDTGWAVGTVLRSRAFFAEANLGTRVLGPVEYVVGAARALELFDPPPSTLALADWAARLGQDLFYPPNVGGWPGGRNWISAQTMIGRGNYAVALVGGKLCRGEGAFDPLALPKRHGRGDDLEAVLNFYVELVHGAPPGPAWRDRLRASLGPKATAAAETVRAALPLILAAPEAQLV